jgi:hypothetical protein
MNSGQEIEAWLFERLSESWSAPRLAPLLTVEILERALQKFKTIDTQIKMQLLLSFLHISEQKRLQLATKIEVLRQLPHALSLPQQRRCVQEVCELACSDPDDWVGFFGHMLREFGRSGKLDLNPPPNSAMQSGLAELRLACECPLPHARTCVHMGHGSARSASGDAGV